MCAAPALGGKCGTVGHVMKGAFQQNAFLFSDASPIIAVSGEQASGADNGDCREGKIIRLGPQRCGFRASIRIL